MAGFGIEQEDVLLSVQLVLIREREGDVAPRGESAAGSEQRHEGVPQLRLVERGNASAGSRPRRPSAPAPPPMVDPETGVGSWRHLRRDLARERTAQTTGGAVLIALGIHSLDQIRLVLGEDAARAVLLSLVEVAPFALHARDRLYRTGRDELSILLADTGDEGVEAARASLEDALGKNLAGRGYPAVSLVARVVDIAPLLAAPGATGGARSVAF